MALNSILVDMFSTVPLLMSESGREEFSFVYIAVGHT